MQAALATSFINRLEILLAFLFQGESSWYQEEKGDIRRQEKINKNRDTGVQTDDAKFNTH